MKPVRKENLKVGYQLLSYDEEDAKWYKAEVVKVTDDYTVLKDVDPDSEFQGMLWDVTWGEWEKDDGDQYREP